MFPHLYPYGKGYWYRQSNGVTIGKYFKMRLLHIDPRWRNDRNYTFFAYDWMVKSRVFTINNMIRVSTEISLQAGSLQSSSNNPSDSEYFKYGSVIPKCITGGKAYWNAKYLDLISAIRQMGLPQLFLTFTANDQWPELQIILKG